MATIPQPLINGVRHEYSSCEFKFNGRIFTGVKSVNYGIELAPSLVYGASPAPLGLTRGVLTPNADFEMLHAELYEMLDALGAGFGEVSFLGLATISESWTTTRTDSLIGCRIKKIDHGLAQGADAIYHKVELALLDILLDGKSMTTKPLGGAQTAAAT